VTTAVLVSSGEGEHIVTMPPATPIILFGAFDRHNLGDMLFPHVLATLLAPRPVVFAGLVERDHRPWGGHRVAALPKLAEAWGDGPAHLIHVGGELLTCNTFEAAVMVQPPQEAVRITARYESSPEAGMAWAKSHLGIDRELAYVQPKSQFRCPGRFVYNAVGGVDLPRLPRSMQSEVANSLREADFVSVRDVVTQRALTSLGIEASIAPDPAVMVAELFGERTEARAAQGEPARVRATFREGYIAFQCSAEFADDATLDTLAGQLRRIMGETGLGVVLFRAGAAPWHDSLEVYGRLAGRLPNGSTRIFESLNIWDICALIANSRAYCGSSLHGRIVALAFGLPCLNIVPGCKTARGGKQAAYAATWETEDVPTVVGIEALASTVCDATRSSRARLADKAKSLAARCVKEMSVWMSQTANNNL
jgi:hypothetical protein